MKKITLLSALTCLALTAMGQSWPTPQTEARPGTRWWWLGSAVDTKNLNYSINEFARAGIGSVEVTPIYGVQGNDKNDIPYLSDQWMEMLRYTQQVGKEHDVLIDMNNGTGWPFGGPEVTTGHAASKGIFQRYQAKGGNVVMDISVTDPSQRKVATLEKVMAYQGKQIIDLTRKVKNDTLRWKAPAGEWDIIAVYCGKTQQKVKRAAPGGAGWVIDHFSKEAVKLYLQKFDEAFDRTSTPYPHTFFNDSYEVHGADWTPGLLQEFAKRRGYRLEDHFPEFLSEESTDNSRRLLSDFRETVSELLNANFTSQWTAWANRHGSTTRNQAHGSPANLIDTYAIVDVPECEGFGLSEFHIKGLRKDSLTRKNDSDISMLKYASSAAHITGKKFTSSETFTWLTEHFRTSLSQCKPDMDLMFTAGVNHAFFHGTPYSPQEAKWPGWQFYASINMSPNNSIWRDAPAFFSYITRCQSFLQMGKPDNDFLVYLPLYDIWYDRSGTHSKRVIEFSIHNMGKFAPGFIRTVDKILECGYDVDYISDKFIRTTRCKDGQLITAGNTSYKALVIPGAKRMPVDVLKKLMQLAQQGATVVFLNQYPDDVPGYANAEKRLASLQDLLDKLPSRKDENGSTIHPYGKGRIITGTDYAQTLKLCGITPEAMRTDEGMHVIRRSNEGGHHYFIANLQGRDVEGWMTIGVEAKEAALFNPMNGDCGRAAIRQQDGKAQVYLQLKSGESVILQTYRQPQTFTKEWTYLNEKAVSLSLDHGWKLHFAESTPEIKGTFDIDTPQSWTNLPDSTARVNMGTGVYTLTFDLPQMEADDWMLDLGDVRESARVKVNGKEAGILWAVPYRTLIGKLLQPGRNVIEVEVTNLAANRIASYDRQGINWRIFKEINVVDLKYKKTKYGHWEPMPAGLNSSVKLIPMRRTF